MEAVADQCEQSFPDHYYDFVGAVDDFLVVYDSDYSTYFCSCYQCLVKLFKICKPDERIHKYHVDCVTEILTYLYERSKKQVKGEYIYHYWDLCNGCTLMLLNKIKDDLMTVFHTNGRG